MEQILRIFAEKRLGSSSKTSSRKKTCFAFLQQLKKASEIIFFPSSIASKIKKVWHFFVVVAAKQSQTKQNGDKHKQKQNPG